MPTRVLEAIASVIILGFWGWYFVRSLRRSESPIRFIWKWIISAAALAVMVWVAAPLAGSAGPKAFDGIVITLLCCLVLTATWRHAIASLISKPFESLYDGGSAQIEPEPLYSIAISKRKQGKYDAAIGELRNQLSKFPNDFQSQMMIAEILAENLNDLEGARTVIHRIRNQPDHAPRNIALALNTLADWHLTYGLDRDSAKRELEQIEALLPHTAFALAAAQRIAHLATAESLLAKHDRPVIQLPQGIENIGLLPTSAHLRPKETTCGQLAAEYVAQLEQHPFDIETREKLAVLYADDFQRLDLATAELEQLISLPHQSGKAIVHWLNLLADLQIRHCDTVDSARQTLQRIVEGNPNHPAADLARNRINHLALEFKAKQKSQAVKLGSYEQNIGLKKDLPG